MDFLIRRKLENEMVDEVNLPPIVDDGEKAILNDYVSLSSIFKQDTSILSQGRPQSLIELDEH